MAEAKAEFDAYENQKYSVIWYGNTRVVRHYVKRYCTVCGRKAYCRYMCRTHYHIWWTLNTESGKAARIRYKANKTEYNKRQYRRLVGTPKGREKQRELWRKKYHKRKQNGSSRTI